MKKSYVLSTLVLYGLMTSMLGLMLDLVWPERTVVCLNSINPFAIDRGEYRSATGNRISNGKMSETSEAMPALDHDQKAIVTGNLAKGWQDWSNWADLTAHYEIDSDQCHTEGSCQRIDIPRLNSGYVTFAHWLRMPTGVYAADLWIRSSSRSAVIVSVKNVDDSSGEQQFEPRKFLAGPTWKHVELSGRCPGWNNADLTVSVLSGNASVWIDDVRLERRFDWVSLFSVLTVIAAGVGLTHLLDFVLSKTFGRRKPSAQERR